jgi:response regulator NasT
MSLKILLVDTDCERAEALERTLIAAGFFHISRVGDDPDLVGAVERLAPDLVIIDMALPDRDALEDVRTLSAAMPRPIVMFSDADDPAFVDEAIAAGVCSYNLSGAASQEIKPIVASAIALFRRYRHVETELAAANALLEERRLLERAKAILMRDRKMTEPEAYRWLQRKAMNESRKLSQIVAEFVKQEEADARRVSGGAP